MPMNWYTFSADEWRQKVDEDKVDIFTRADDECLGINSSSLDFWKLSTEIYS